MRVGDMVRWEYDAFLYSTNRMTIVEVGVILMIFPKQEWPPRLETLKVLTRNGIEKVNAGACEVISEGG